RDIAAVIMEHIREKNTDGMLSKVEVAGPGFINFFIAPHKWYEVLRQVHDMDAAYGTSTSGQGKRVQVEFVSANPTGPLHVGHGRCAAVGDTLAAVLCAAGFKVEKEYYINDSGLQIATLGRSVYLRYLALFGKPAPLPEEAYQGDYIRDIARGVAADEGDRLLNMKEDDAVAICAKRAADEIMAGIKEDLKAFHVSFDNWFSERSLVESGAVETAINDLKTRGIIYEHDRALWFKTRQFGDEKDRVVVRANGAATYFASDIAYHQDKLERGFDRIIDIWGADHHGYIPRISACVQALGHPKDRVCFVLVQLVNLLREGMPVAMSTRAGQFVTLREVMQEVGTDAARFSFLLRHYDSPLDFDLELAKKQSNENPVYYVQYVHARISNILRKARERGYNEIRWEDDFADLINLPEEIALIKLMQRYPDVVTQSARLLEPHRIPFYLMELAGAFHGYYHDRHRHQVVSDDPRLSAARLFLVSAIRIIIRNGLALMSVSAPQQM
ncbi:MAG: arginine--tRNA ligase, partial [Deltaproteobacteria bacterium]|nr:arginine--tRNA ligase [Deltaproteobacteria bacterium]